MVVSARKLGHLAAAGFLVCAVLMAPSTTTHLTAPELTVALESRPRSRFFHQLSGDGHSEQDVRGGGRLSDCHPGRVRVDTRRETRAA